MEIKVKDLQPVWVVTGQAPNKHIYYMRVFLSKERAEETKMEMAAGCYNTWTVHESELDIYGMDELDYE